MRFTGWFDLVTFGLAVLTWMAVLGLWLAWIFWPRDSEDSEDSDELS